MPNTGVRVRFEEARLLTRVFRHELTFGLGLDVTLWPGPVCLGRELFGRTALDRGFEGGDVTPVEAMLGPKWWVVPGLSIELGVGMGLVQGTGAPDFRLLTGVAWSPAREPESAD